MEAPPEVTGKEALRDRHTLSVHLLWLLYLFLHQEDSSSGQHTLIVKGGCEAWADRRGPQPSQGAI